MIKSLYILLFLKAFSTTENIYLINSIKENANNNILTQNYEKAENDYFQLIEKHKITEGWALVNYANLLMINHDTLKARGIYGKIISSSKSNHILSIAYCQAGFIEYMFNKNKEEAINLFKIALIKNENNSVARQNLYLLLNLLKSENSSKSNKQNPTNNKTFSQNQNSANNNKSTTTTTEDKFKNINMSIERAELLLDALQKDEVQYIHQLNKIKNTTDYQQNNLPKW